MEWNPNTKKTRNEFLSSFHFAARQKRSWTASYEEKRGRNNEIGKIFTRSRWESSDWKNSRVFKKAVTFETSHAKERGKTREDLEGFPLMKLFLVHDKFPQCTPDTCALTVLFKSIDLRQSHLHNVIESKERMKIYFHVKFNRLGLTSKYFLFFCFKNDEKVRILFKVDKF